MSDTRKLEDQNRELKEKAREMKSTLSDLYGGVKKCLITLDWTIRLGCIAGCWWFPLPQERLTQSIAVASLMTVLAVSSYGIRKMKETEERLKKIDIPYSY